MFIRALIAASALLFATGVQASTVFAPTDGDVNFIFGELFGNQLFMFDDNDAGNFAAAADNLAVPIPSLVGVAGPNGDGDHIATNELGDTLILTDSDHFVLALWDGTNWWADTNVVEIGANAFRVFFDLQGTFVAVDVHIVPIPAAMWLFASGMLGLIGVARRRRS